MKRFLMALVGGLMFAGGVQAAEALVTTDLNMRTSPSTRGSIIETIPAGALVDVRRCRSGNQWCRVNWNGQRGWSNAVGLAFREAPYNTDDMVDAAMTTGAAVAAAILVEGNIYRYGRDERPRRHNRKDRSYSDHKKYDRSDRVYRYGRKDHKHRAHRDERRYDRDYRRKNRSYRSTVGPGPNLREQGERKRDARRDQRRHEREARRDRRKHKAYRHDRRKHKKKRSYRSSIPVN